MSRQNRPKISQDKEQRKPFKGALNDFGSALCDHIASVFDLDIASAHPAVVESLHVTVGGFCLRAILQEFAYAHSLSLPRNRESYYRLVNSLFSDEWREYLFSQYPELNRLAKGLEGRLNFSKSIVAEFQNISKQDAAILGIKKEAAVLDVQPRGDFHSHGSSTVRLTLDDGTNLYYKPTHAGNTLLVQSLLEIINPDIKAPLHSPRTVATDSGHWQADINSSKNKSAAPDRYYQYGAWLAVSDALGLTDLHMENVLETEDGPVIIDFECYPSTDYRSRNLRNPLPKIARSGLLPAPFTLVANAPLVDWSALGGEIDNPPESWAMHFIEDDGLPTIHLTEAPQSNSTGRDNRKTNLAPSHSNELALTSGYADTQRVLNQVGWEEVKSLVDFHQPELRVVVRATQIYQNCLRRSSYPKYLRDAVTRTSALRSWLSSESVDSEILEKEISELSDFLIPSFRISINSTHLGGAEVYKPLEMMEASFAEATSPQRTRQVERYIRQIFEVRRDNPVVMPPVTYNRINGRSDSIEKLEAISSIVESISTLGHSSSLGPTWINAQKDQEGSWVQNGYSPYLYSGVAGIYLSLAETVKHAKIPADLRISVKNSLNSLRFHLRTLLDDPDMMLSCGLFEGAGGILYALSSDASISELEEAATAFCNLTDERLHLIGYDIISGTSGVLLLASRLKRIGILPERMLRLQLSCINHLAQSSEIGMNNLRMWDKDEDWVGGLSHGPAGVAWSVRESDFSHQYSPLAEDAWRTQSSLLLSDGFSWRNRNLSQETPLCAWCHGTEGIALMLHLTSQETRDFATQKNALRDAPLPADPSLCHGLAGRYLTLYELGLKEEAEAAINKLWHYASKDLDELVALDDSLMTGRAGILLALLHDYTGGMTMNPLKVQLGGQIFSE